MAEILDLFNYEFMRRAFVVGSLFAIILPCIGLTVVLKRLSMIGDTLAHSSLAGVTIGLVFGFNPLLGAIVACVVAGLSIEYIRNSLKAYEEISTVIILAISIGIAGIMATSVSNSNEVTSYLFGSILTISDSEYQIVLAVSALVIFVYAIMYRQFYLSVFDSKVAQFLGINTKVVNFIFTFLSAVTISISAKAIGSLIVSSLLVIPVIIAMQFAKTYKNTLILSMVLSLVFVFLGLIISFKFDYSSGSLIVLIAAFTLILSLALKKVK